MGKARIVERLNWYYPMERFHAQFTFSIITVALLLNNLLVDIVFLLYGLLLIIFILFQGQHYWKLKLLRVMGKTFDQEKNIRLFRTSRTLNNYLIACIPIAFVLQLQLSGWTIKPENLMSWGLVANVFGILEHVNYYYRQLSIDNSADINYLLRNKKLKVASLAKDLLRNKI